MTDLLMLLATAFQHNHTNYVHLVLALIALLHSLLFLRASNYYLCIILMAGVLLLKKKILDARP